MKNLKVVVHYDGTPGRGAKCTVSVKQLQRDVLHDIPSPSKLKGHGGCFGDALNDYIAQMDKYLAELKTFRNNYLNTSQPYSEAIETMSNLTEIRKRD